MKLQEALGLIPDNSIAQRALELAVENSLNKDVPDCATALESGFLFPVTSEGATYWRSVVDALRAGNDLPPLPFVASWRDKKTVGSAPDERARALDASARVPGNTPPLPPFPPAPDGMQWVHVPEGLVPEGSWHATQDTVWAWATDIESQWHLCDAGSSCVRDGTQLFAKLIPIVAAPAAPAAPPALPPYPEAPEGKVWVYVGVAVRGLRGLGMWASCDPSIPEPSWSVASNGLLPSGGYPDYHYLQLVDGPALRASQRAAQCAETCTPNPESGDIAQENAQMLPYPPVPAGYDRWIYRGFGYDSGGADVWCAICFPNQEWYVWREPTRATGNTQGVYLEAVKDTPLQLRVGGYYRRRNGSTCHIVIEDEEDVTYCFADEFGEGYTSSGRYISDDSPDEFDIMEEVPAPVLQLRVGGYYRRRDGRVVGPATTYDHPQFTIALASCIYPLNGVHVYEHFDIVEEIIQEQYNQEPRNQERSYNANR